MNLFRNRSVASKFYRPAHSLTNGNQLKTNTFMKKYFSASAHENLRICFVHTPMSSVEVPGRDVFWKNFDRRYYMVHDGLKPVSDSIWELPHWMTWLGGVLKAHDFRHINALNLYTSTNINDGIDKINLEKDLAEHPADVYLYSPMTPNLHLAFDIAKMVKIKYPKAINIFGGIIATPLHTKVAAHQAVDYVVRDRGEYALPELLKAIAGVGDVHDVKNITYQHVDDNIWIHPKLYDYMDPADIPFPYIDLFPEKVGDYLRYIRQNYALGCPFRCSFCTIQTIGRNPGYFPTERVIAEIKAYRKHYGEHHNIYFGDETFTLNVEKTLEICAALKEQGNITYDIQTRLMSLNSRKVMSALQDSGCKWVEVGIESLVQKSLHIHKQSTNIGKIREMLKKCRDKGLPVCSFIVNGLPDQTPDEMRYSVDVVCKLIDEQLLHASYFFGLTPYPGSDMYKHPEKYGLKLRHHDYPYYNEDLAPVYDTAFATSEEMYEVFQEGVLKIGQAMSSQPYLGNTLSEDIENQLGKSLTHV